MNQPACDHLFLNPHYHDLIGLIYDAVTSRDGFFPFLKRFIEVFNGHSGSFAIFDTQSNSPLGYWVVNIPEHALEFYVEHVAPRDILVESALSVFQQGNSRFVAGNLDIPNVKEMREATRVNEWLTSFGAWEAAGAIVFQDENYLNFFGIQRTKNQPEFTREELAIFDLFLPHLKRAVQLYTKMGALDLNNIPERSALNQVQQGILICDTTFRVVFKNSTADHVLATNNGLRLSSDGLLSFHGQEFSRQFVVHLSDAVRASVDSADTDDKILRYRNGSQNLTIVVSPLTAPADASGSHYRGGAMISLYDWVNRKTISAEKLQHFFGLSKAEARVAAQLAKGDSPIEIAEHLSRSRETVKSHLQAIYRKTGTSRQGELVSLLTASSSAA
jgi:DNA-binding CsgD family transcriptional regulator